VAAVLLALAEMVLRLLPVVVVTGLHHLSQVQQLPALAAEGVKDLKLQGLLLPALMVPVGAEMQIQVAVVLVMLMAVLALLLSAISVHSAAAVGLLLPVVVTPFTLSHHLAHIQHDRN